MPMPTKRHTAGRPERDDDKDRRRLIMDSAVRLYAKQGFEAVTFAHIAKEAGVATSLIRHYFGAKEDFRRQCSRYVLDEVGQVFTALEALRESTDGADGLDKTVQGLIASLRTRVHLLRYLARLFMDGNEEANRFFAEYYQNIRAYTDQMAAAGQLRDDIDPVWAAFHFIYIQLGTAFLQDQIEAVLGVDPYDLDVTLDRNKTMLSIARDGVFKKPD